MEIIDIFGSIGAIIALIAFILIQTDRLKNSDFTYDFLNFLSGFILAIYAYIIASLPFLIINLVWASFSLFDLIFKDRKSSFKNELKSFLKK